MLEFDLNSDYGFVRVGRLIYSWLNKFSHYEDGVTSVSWIGGETEWAGVFHPIPVRLLKRISRVTTPREHVQHALLQRPIPHTENYI